MKLKKVLDNRAGAVPDLIITHLLSKSVDEQVDMVRSHAFWAELPLKTKLEAFLKEFIKLPERTQRNALLNPHMWQALDSRLLHSTDERGKGNRRITDKMKHHIETILSRQSDETLNYLFLMPSFLQMLPFNNFHTNYIIGLKLKKLNSNVKGTAQEKKIYALMFEALSQMPRGRKLLEEGITCFQTRYLFDTDARSCAHWLKDLKICTVSKVNSPLDELENNPVLFQYTVEHLFHELCHMNQYDCGCQENTGATLFEKLAAYRLLELETAVLNALPTQTGTPALIETPAKKLSLFFMKKYMAWLIQKNGGDEQKAKTAFAKHLWSNSPDVTFDEASKIRKIFTSWNKQYNLEGLCAVNTWFDANAEKCITRLRTKVGVNLADTYFLDSQNMSLNIEIPSRPYIQNQVFNTLQQMQHTQKKRLKADRFLIAALSMEKALSMTPDSFLNKTFEYCFHTYHQTGEKMYLKGLMHILSAENFQDAIKLEKAMSIDRLQEHLTLRVPKNTLVTLTPLHHER